MRGRGMWTVGLVLVGLAYPLGVAGQASGETAEILAVVTTLFDGMREKDEAKLRGVWHDEARLQTAGLDQDGVPRLSSTPIEGFVAGVLGSQAELDEVTFDEVVQIDGALATVWAPYNLFVNGSFQHCGVDAIQFVRTQGGWKIFQLTDTRKREGCDPERRG